MNAFYHFAIPLTPLHAVFALVAGLVGSSNLSWAQVSHIKGTVLAGDGSPMKEATIVIERTDVPDAPYGWSAVALKVGNVGFAVAFPTGGPGRPQVYKCKSNGKGEYSHYGLPRGHIFNVALFKDGVLLDYVRDFKLVRGTRVDFDLRAPQAKSD